MSSAIDFVSAQAKITIPKENFSILLHEKIQELDKGASIPTHDMNETAWIFTMTLAGVYETRTLASYAKIASRAATELEDVCKVQISVPFTQTGEGTTLEEAVEEIKKVKGFHGYAIDLELTTKSVKKQSFDTRIQNIRGYSERNTTKIPLVDTLGLKGPQVIKYVYVGGGRGATKVQLSYNTRSQRLSIEAPRGRSFYHVAEKFDVVKPDSIVLGFTKAD